MIGGRGGGGGGERKVIGYRDEGRGIGKERRNEEQELWFKERRNKKRGERERG